MIEVQERKAQEDASLKEEPFAYSTIFDDLLEGLDAARAHFQGQVTLPTTVIVTNDTEATISATDAEASDPVPAIRNGSHKNDPTPQ